MEQGIALEGVDENEKKVENKSERKMQQGHPPGLKGSPGMPP